MRHYNVKGKVHPDYLFCFDMSFAFPSVICEMKIRFLLMELLQGLEREHGKPLL